ncbi:MAG: glycosyltransferase family 2 protein [Selenomonadaceae bacterium]|nr:glycosyltransferase family 2 protein [Selenomonadaceae bacterium]
MRIYLSPQKNYAISVIIPLYNAEKYIAECLDSLLIQTFQDFEVIVVDDCSTDDSASIVKGYISKFNGRIKLTKTEKNLKHPGASRNIGLSLASGEYIQFLDADDFLLGSALETSYNAAIKYDADIVNTSSYYRLNSPNDVFVYKDGFSQNLEDKTELTVDNPNENFRRLFYGKGEGNFNSCWSKLFRRDFLIKNKIIFPNLSIAEDVIFVMKAYSHAKKFLRITTPLYFYRSYNSSITRTNTKSPKQISFWFSDFTNFVKVLHEIEDNNEVLLKNPAYCLPALKKFFSWCLLKTAETRKELDSEEIYKVLYSEFAKDSSDFTAMILSFLFGFINDEKNAQNYHTEIINKFQRYITAKIFVRINKKMDAETLQVLSVSDKEATLTKPEWWQREGTCHVIDSCTGNLDITAKAMIEGQVEIILSGPWVPNPEDKSKRLPYWIDYTVLTVNDKKIFDSFIPVWHDKPYVYSMNVNADEEIKIKVEWLPHNSDLFEQKAATTPQNDNIPKPATSQHKVTVSESKILKPLSKFDTARIDVKFVSKTSTGDFKIFSVSDEKAKVLKPGWYQKSGIGYVIQSLNGELTFRAKATAKGLIEFNLRGIEVRNSEDWTNRIAKRIPYWVDYTKLIVNGKTILDKLTPAWCDEPYRYNLNVNANEEVTVKIEWRPHRDGI